MSDLEKTKGRNNSISSDEHNDSDDNAKNKTSTISKKKKIYRDANEKDDMGGFPSVFEDLDNRNKLFEHLPALKVWKMKKNPRILNAVTGPLKAEHPIPQYEPFICGRSISTYPHVPGKQKRDGDPVCDSYCIQLLEGDTAIAVVTDGCNWGKRPMEASNAAKEAFVDYLRAHQADITDVRDAGHYLLRALSYCHFKIIEGKEDIWEAGTTTLLGGILLKLKKSKEDLKKEAKDGKPNTQSWVFVCVSIGDCKAYHFSYSTKNINDITAGNRKNVYDARDPGGRLGPYVGDQGGPDLRNVAVYYEFCEENDLILVVSDGVHDNLDPQILGVSPKEINAEAYANINTWQDFATEDEVEKIKTQHMLKILSNDLIFGGEEDRKMRLKIFAYMSAEDDDPVSPVNVTNRIMKHCLNVTGRGREWMEQNPKERLPSDYSSFPGKMDHATCAVIRVGEYEKEIAKAATRAKK